MDQREFFAEATEAQRYKLTEVIGKGSYGVVASAVDQFTGAGRCCMGLLLCRRCWTCMGACGAVRLHMQGCALAVDGVMTHRVMSMHASMCMDAMAAAWRTSSWLAARAIPLP